MQRPSTPTRLMSALANINLFSAVTVLAATITFVPRASANAELTGSALGGNSERDASATTDSAPVKKLGTVTVTGGRVSSLPTHIPTTVEGITGREVEEKINATDAEDALKYFPSLLVRKRYIGDYDHAVLASRASGTGNSARSLVYADGILLSNLLGNGASFTPRWGLVTPEEIDRVDVLYGPFSAAYPGNSVGAVVDYITRMPDKFEAQIKAGAFSQNYSQYGTSARYSGHQLSASLGNRQGAWSWWLNVSRLDSDGHPIAFANKLVSAGTASAAGTPVTGAIFDKNPRNQDWLILGATNQIHTVQDHAKAKVAFDFSPTLRASYTLGFWKNDNERFSETYLRDASGNPVWSGNVNVAGRQYAVAPTDFSLSVGQLEHIVHGVSVKQNSRGVFDWEVAGSVYDYRKDQVRSPTVAIPVANGGGAGRLTDMNGTGWNTLSLKGTWRPDGENGAHLVDIGLQRDTYELNTLVSNLNDWIGGAPVSRVSAFAGNTRLTSLYAQDTWRIAQAWRATIGARIERWEAYGGTVSNTTSTLGFAKRSATTTSPKFALAFQASPAWTLKASLGRGIRNPTVSELYQGSISANVVVNNDPNLKSERSWTSELTAERDLGNGILRTTLFFERTRDALYSQTNVSVIPNVTNIQNVDDIRTNGLEIAYAANDVLMKDLDISSSLTWADSIIEKNAKFPDSVGKWQPRVPRWRANLLATWRATNALSATFGLRYSGRQFNTLDNADPNGFTYTGTSKFLVADVKLRYKFDAHWSASIGVDNLNNEKYWNFHPYPQRTWLGDVTWKF